MTPNTPYISTSDHEYDRHRQAGLSETEKSILSLLKEQPEPGVTDKNLAQLARELHCNCSDLRSSIRRLISIGLLQQNKALHYKLTRAGKRLE